MLHVVIGTRLADAKDLRAHGQRTPPPRRILCGTEQP
jgi:hypothetical protein